MVRVVFVPLLFKIVRDYDWVFVFLCRDVKMPSSKKNLRFRVFGLGSKKRKVCTRRTCLFFCRLMMKKSSSIFHVVGGCSFSI